MSTAIHLDPIRDLLTHEIGSALEIATAAGWNQTHDDWERMLRLNSAHCRCIAADSQIAATASLITYGNTLGWVGMVLTRSDYRRHGLARSLMLDLLAAAQHTNVKTLKLDATDEGRPLYESLGFVVETSIERWGRDANPAYPAKPVEESVSPDATHHALDLEAFGADRASLLSDLAQQGRVTTSPDGFALSRPGRVAQYLGPCVATSAEAARDLIANHLADTSMPWYWDLLPDESAARSLAEHAGFTMRRRLWRMCLGPPIPLKNDRIFAIGGFELG